MRDLCKLEHRIPSRIVHQSTCITKAKQEVCYENMYFNVEALFLYCYILLTLNGTKLEF